MREALLWNSETNIKFSNIKDRSRYCKTIYLINVGNPKEAGRPTLGAQKLELQEQHYEQTNN